MESYELFITKNTEIFKDKVIILYTYLLRFYRIPVHFCDEIFRKSLHSKNFCDGAKNVKLVKIFDREKNRYTVLFSPSSLTLFL